MDRAMLLDHLAIAESHVAQGERHIAEQQERIATLARDGHDIVAAEELLRTLLETQRLHVADRDRIREELAEAT
jgi:hypothetical protein